MQYFSLLQIIVSIQVHSNSVPYSERLDGILLCSMASGIRENNSLHLGSSSDVADWFTGVLFEVQPNKIIMATVSNIFILISYDVIFPVLSHKIAKNSRKEQNFT
jgi:hypothetical protein